MKLLLCLIETALSRLFHGFNSFATSDSLYTDGTAIVHVFITTVSLTIIYLAKITSFAQLHIGCNHS
jgi:hypothetical protein